MNLRLVGFGISSSQSSGSSGNSDAKVKAKEEKFRVVSGGHERLSYKVTREVNRKHYL